MAGRNEVIVTGASLKTPSPMGGISGPKNIAEAVIYLMEASRVIGEVLHVDDSAHAGRW